MSTEWRLVARMRGGFVGGASGAVSIAAHAAAGGAVPGQSAAVLLLLASVAVGAVAAGTRLPVIAVLAAGQVVGHLALALEFGHMHVPSPAAGRSTRRVCGRCATHGVMRERTGGAL